ncbi:MAG: hypothetical protein IKD18_04125 [Clostridia bacterium]|nr:hypothetical protein [Clostridia bacterium]
MNLNEIAKNIGIEKYDAIPEEMLPYYPIPEERKGELCSIKMIDRLQERFNVFKEYYPTVKEYWVALEKDPLRKAYVDTASLFMKDSSYGKCTKIPVPAPNGTPEGDLLQFFIHIPAIESAYDKYRSRGFSHEETLTFLDSYYEDMAHTHKNVVGRPALVDIYFRWLCLYTKALIFYHCGLNYQLTTNKAIYALKHKETGEIRILSNEGRMLHRGGYPLGTVDFEDEEGAVETSFEETEDAYFGFPVQELLFSTKKERFSKSEWEMVLRPKDHVVAIHIPKKTDFSEETVSRSLEEAKEIVTKRFPEWNPQFFTCSSWLLSPDLKKIMKPGSRILSFGDRYVRYPVKSNGQSVFVFVFPQDFKGSLEELPEDTSLMRALKKMYIEGDHIHNYGGVIEF